MNVFHFVNKAWLNLILPFAKIRQINEAFIIINSIIKSSPIIHRQPKADATVHRLLQVLHIPSEENELASHGHVVAFLPAYRISAVFTGCGR
jgi:hypothetical protein